VTPEEPDEEEGFKDIEDDDLVDAEDPGSPDP
jgi:hypothetical protein